MSILINGIDVPTEHTLWIVVSTDGTVEYEQLNEWRISKEKAVTISPHGRLIDADELTKKALLRLRLAIENNYTFGAAWYERFICHIKRSPTIIPAEGEVK